jgi:ADP-ribose pyrophosphatase
MALVTTRRIYTGRVLNLDLDTVRFPNGSVGELEMIRHPGASAVVPFVGDPRADDPEVLMIQQFRHAADRYVWEIPAGRLDVGEDPEACARRELEEEAGVLATTLQRLTTIWTTPGFTDERIHLFLAIGLTPGTIRREPDELVEVRRLQWSKVLRLAEQGEIADGKTLVSLLFVESFRRGP